MIEQASRYMPVMRINEDKTKSLVCIDLREVDFIEMDKQTIIFHIGNDQFKQLATKSDFEELLSPEGFDALDRPNLVNLRKIRHFDEEFGKVFFVENPTNKDKYATVARIKYKHIVPLIKQIMSRNNNTTTEVKVEGRGIAGKLKGFFQPQ